MSIEKLYKLYLKTGKITTDSRNVPQGSIFFALKGEKFDGNRFVADAFRNGASFAVVSDKTAFTEGKTLLVDDTLKTLQDLAAYHRQKANFKVFGITGSNGKTTTKELIFRVLQKKYKTIATQGNYNNHIGVPLTLLSAGPETEFAVIEMGANHPGEIAELCEIANPDFGVITNIGYAHLEGFGTLENLITTKLALFEAVKRRNGVFLLNTDDAVLAERITDYEKIFPYGQRHDSKVKVVEMFNDLYLKIVAGYNNANHLIRTRLVGKYNVHNILAAISAGLVCGVDEDLIDEAIEEYTPSNNRSQLTETQNNTLILDMYNANPTSMAAAVENFYEIDLPRKMLILGDMLELGKNELQEHQKIVDLVVKLKFKNVILVGEIFSQCTLPSHFESFKNVDDLIGNLKQNKLKNYSILLKASNGTGLKKLIKYL